MPHDTIFYMIILKELNVNITGQNKKIYFGKIDKQEEKLAAYKLRYEVYSERGYIDTKNHNDFFEMDSYDLEDKCHHFIASFEQKIIGYVRMIIDTPLPTEKYFTFCEPELIKTIPKDKRCELGRLIVIPLDKDKGEYLPRNLVMLFLLDVASSFGLANNLLGGYSFIKKSLENKFSKLKIPIGEIVEYKQNYPSDGVLSNYFSQNLDPVVPIYFLTKNFYNYAEKTINNSWLFEIQNKSIFTLKDNLYMKFLKELKII